MSAGIYVLYYEKDDGLYYIGQSVGLAGRYEDHCKKLRNHSHHNTKLQELYNLYNEYPTIEILEYLVPEESILNAREIYWIAAFNSFYTGMNETIGGGGLGHGENHPNSKYSNAKYLEILNMLANTNKSIQKIATEVGVDRGVVANISSGTTHRWLESEYPELYHKMKSRDKPKSGCNDLLARGISYPKIVSPDGTEYCVTNIRAFAREHNLNNQDLGKVLRGQRLSTKGWRLAQ